MGLLDAIPGLSVHSSPATAPFDRVKAMRQMSDAAALVEGRMTATGYAWLQEHRQDVFQHLQQASQDLDAAYEAEDDDRFARALDFWVRSYRKAATIFDERPPVIYADGELF